MWGTDLRKECVNKKLMLLLHVRKGRCYGKEFILFGSGVTEVKKSVGMSRQGETNCILIRIIMCPLYREKCQSHFHCRYVIKERPGISGRHQPVARILVLLLQYNHLLFLVYLNAPPCLLSFAQGW